MIGKDLVEWIRESKPERKNGQGVGHQVQSACELASHWEKSEST